MDASPPPAPNPPPGATAPDNSPRTVLLLMAVGLVAGVLLGGLVLMDNPFGGGRATGPTPTPGPAPMAGAPAPDFTLEDTEGNTVRLADLRGQVVLVNFWATWCIPCKLEMPALDREYEALKDQGFTVLGVNYDEPLDDVIGFGDELGLTFPLLLDPGGEVTTTYRVRGWPTTFFINRDGIIDRQYIGVLTEGQLRDYLTELGLSS